jgi:hypothetical protein
MSIINVNAGQNPQSAIDNAQPGDVINLEAVATFRGPLVLSPKSSSTPITIQSSRVSELPDMHGFGAHVYPLHAPLMPRIIAPSVTVSNDPQAITTKQGASFYKLDGIEVLPDPALAPRGDFVDVYDLVRFGGGRDTHKTLDAVPHHLEMDRCYVHGDGVLSFQRGVSLNSSDTNITRTYIGNITGRGMEAQGICSWNTPGRNQIVDSFVEATTQSILIGGSDPALEAMIPSDCKILRTHLFKQPAWKGKGWVIKNGLEFKLGIRFVVDGCVIENNWAGEGQSGIIVLFTVRNQEGSAPWSIVRDILMTNTIVRNAEGGALNFLGNDDEKPSQRASHVTIRNCIFDQIKGTFMQMSGFDDVTFEHNTHLQTGNTLVFYGLRSPLNPVSNRLSYRFNVTQEHEYGIRDEDGTTEGTAALEKWAAGYQFTDNVMATPYTKNPTGNLYPPELNLPADLRSPYPGAGCDVDALKAAQASTTTTPLPLPIPDPIPTPTPTPTPTPVPRPAALYKPGDTIKLDMDGVFVRSGPSLSQGVTGTQSANVFATVNSEAAWDDTGSKYFYNLDFDSGVDGWCPEEHLIAAVRPVPTPIPTPTPTPTPIPIPPLPCAMLVSVEPPVLAQWGTGKLVVTLSGLSGPATIRVTANTGQVSVSPPSQSVASGATSAIVEFSLQAKKKSSSMVVTGPCGTQTVMVNVR